MTRILPVRIFFGCIRMLKDRRAMLTHNLWAAIAAIGYLGKVLPDI